MSASPVAQLVKNPHANAEDSRDVGSIAGLGRSIEKETATHSSILDWRIPWTEEPSRLQSTVLQRVRQLKRLSTHTHRQQAGVPQHPGVFLPLSGCGFLCSEHLLILSLPGEKKSLQLWKKYIYMESCYVPNLVLGNFKHALSFHLVWSLWKTV